jgi:hypothetical protein
MNVFDAPLAGGAIAFHNLWQSISLEFSDSHDFLLIAVSNTPLGGTFETSLRYRRFWHGSFTS